MSCNELFHHLLSRRQFIARTGAAALALHPLMGCSGSADPRYPTPKFGDTYFTTGYSLPQTQSAENLATFLESDQPAYGLNGWFFMGTVIDENNPDDDICFIIQAQRNEEVPIPTAWSLGTGYIRRRKGKTAAEAEQWKLWGYPIQDEDITITSNPWSVVMYTDPATQQDPFFTMQTVRRERMGQAGTQYIVTVNIPSSLLNQELGQFKGEFRFTDQFGVINQGYGTAALCVQNITPEQRAAIMGSYGGYIQAYLEGTGDPMIDQGVFYYQLPFLKVDSFSITAEDSTSGVLVHEDIKGTDGLQWVDITISSYDAKARKAYANMFSTFFCIQFPEQSMAMMVLQLDSANGTVFVASMYDDTSGQTQNSARKQAFSWPINGITIEKDTDQWTSGATKKTWPRRYYVRLRSPQRNADLTINMVMDNMEIVQSNEVTYAGPITVTGTLDGQDMGKGQGFIEAWSGIKADPLSKVVG
ncbi:MAG TPA: lipocalin family protein [Desulfuromonadaceae bacterium]